MRLKKTTVTFSLLLSTLILGSNGSCDSHRLYLKGEKCIPVSEFAVPSGFLQKFPPLKFPGVDFASKVSGLQANLTSIEDMISRLESTRKAWDLIGGISSNLPTAGQTLSMIVSGAAEYFTSVEKLTGMRQEIKTRMAIDESLLTQDLVRLSAQTKILRNLLKEMMNSDTTIEERSLSVVPAMQACEYIAYLFSDTRYIAYKYSAIFAPYLITFAGLYSTIANIGGQLLPAKRDHLKEEMERLVSTLEMYRPIVVQSRLSLLERWYFTPRTALKACSDIKLYRPGGRALCDPDAPMFTYIGSNDQECDRLGRLQKDFQTNAPLTGCVVGDFSGKMLDDYENGLNNGGIYRRRHPDDFTALTRVFVDWGSSNNIFCGFGHCWQNLRTDIWWQVNRLFDKTISLVQSDRPERPVSTTDRPTMTSAGCLLNQWGEIPIDFMEYGCYNGYCWSYCYVPFYDHLPNWCYTKRDSDYVQCTSKEDCCSHWKCKGDCSV